MNLQTMRSSLAIRTCVASACVALWAAFPAVAQNAPGASTTMPSPVAADAALSAGLAERLALIADESVAAADAPEPLLRQAAALLQSACQYNPREPRFARSLADVWLRLGEQERALAALTRLRTLDPKDQLAMIQFVDLSANRMETAEAKVAYLQQVAGARSIAAEIQSHAAVALADLYFQRAQDGQGRDALQTALGLNPQNVAALTMAYQMAAASGSQIERVRALAALIAASPASGPHLIAFAQECVASGAYEDAHGIYDLGIGMFTARRQVPSVEDLVDLAANELLRGTTADIAPVLQQVLSAIKDDGRLYALDLLVDQFNGGTAEARAPRVAAARGVYLAQLAGVSQLLNRPEDKQMPATSPAVPMPDVTADAAKLNAGDPAQLRGAYVIALAEQIWFDLYFHAAPVDDASISALGSLIGAEDPLVVRFQGWKLLAAGQVEEAKVKLGAVAARDGFAKLGLVAAALQQGNGDQAKSLLTELLGARPTGMVGAYAAVAGKQQGVSVKQTPEEQQVSQVAGPLRRSILDVLGNARSAYLLSASPVNVSFGIGEPLLAKLTIQNNGRAPITIGPGGLIESRYTVDFTTRGDAPRNIPAAVYGQWTAAVRLMPRQSMTQTVRLDRGGLAAFLRQYPTPLVTMSATVTSNPLVGERGSTPAPGGQQTNVGAVVERRSSPLYVEAFRTKLIEQVSKGTAYERLNAIELVSAVVPLLGGPNANADAQALRTQFLTAVETQLRNEPSPEVRAWGTYSAAYANPAATGPIAAHLVSQDDALSKLLGLAIAQGAPATERKRLARVVLDAQPSPGPVLEMASGLEAQADLPPAATQPTGMGNP